MFFHTVRLVKLNRYQLIHAVEESVYIAMYIKRKYKIPYIYDMDSSLAQQLVEKMKYLGVAVPLFSLFEKMAIKESMGVLPMCKSLAHQVAAWVPDKPVQVLEDISLREPGESAPLPDRCKIPLAKPMVMYIGNLEAYQGIDLLMDGFAIARQRISDGNLVIIGGSADDIRAYREKAKHLDIEDSIHFLGPRPVTDLFHYLEQADILASPRIKGVNTPMKIYSYLDSGRALVATRLVTHTQVLTDDTACLVEPNPESMAKGLVKLLSDRAYRQKLSSNAKQHALKHHTFESFRDKVTGFYKQMIRYSQSQSKYGVLPRSQYSDS
jgi:glycosyltransferase involved in cell wall biosynthesis